MKRDKKQSKWHDRREKEASENSQFDPKLHQLCRERYGFQMKRDIEATEEELSGKNLPFKTEK